MQKRRDEGGNAEMWRREDVSDHIVRQRALMRGWPSDTLWYQEYLPA